MCVSCGLICATHHSVDHVTLPVISDHARNDGVQRSLAGRDTVRVSGVEHEAEPRFWSRTPDDGAVNPEPKPTKRELMSDTAFRSRSTTDRKSTRLNSSH